jgi:hypothetical protein
MTPSGIDPATFRQKQDCTYINNGAVFYKVSLKNVLQEEMPANLPKTQHSTKEELELYIFLQ